MQLQLKINSIIGPLFLVANEKAVLGVHWQVQAIEMTDGDETAPHLILMQSANQLTEYLNGSRKHFDLPTMSVGTIFQKKVWQALTEIPYGETRSYQDIANKIQHNKAYRAVGTANGRNPLAIIVPCHRVIASGGNLGGFGGGLEIKKQLLMIEQKKFIN